MTWQWWTIGALAVALVALAVYAASLRRRLSAAQAQDSAVPSVEEPVHASGPTSPEQAAEIEYLITRVGEAEPDPRPTARDSVVLSATLGEPLVKVVALAHGLRRALAPAHRNTIAFAVRQEVRRSRKVRRQEMRAAWREMKARERETA